MPVILDTLNIQYDSIPYNFDKYQIDYTSLNKMCATGNYSFIILCQSDLITVPDLNKIDLPSNMGIIYDLDSRKRDEDTTSRIAANP